MGETLVLKPEEKKVLVAAMALLFKFCDSADQEIRAEADPIGSLLRNFIARHK